ncbi:MAG: redoxin domain-containing protein [Desulfobacterales bacterium]|nr:MAG: redoxin domain-containing protein [Desulfobacterales bacterium]
MRRNKKSFDKAGAQVVLVGMGTPSESTEFAVKFDVPFPMVTDPEKKLYRQFGLKQMSTLGFFSPSVALKGVATIVGGHGIGRPQGDVRQLPGVFIINTTGQIVFSHFSSNPADHPDAKTIIAAL